MSDARKLNTEDRDKIVDLLKTKQIENVRFAIGLLRETADTADIVALFTNRSLIGQFDGYGDEEEDCISELKTFLADWAEQQSVAFRTSDDWLAVQITWNEQSGWLVFESDDIDTHIASLTELSESTATIIALYPGSLNLRQIQSITPEAALQLSRSHCDCESIDLSGLHDLDLKTASFLAHCSAGLLLDGLQELTDELAAILSHHKGPFLSLDGLRHLSATAARILLHYTGTLYLQNLDHVDALDAELARLIFCRPSDDHAEDLYCKTFVPGWSDSSDDDSEYKSREKENELETDDKNGAELALNISLAAAEVLADELRTIDLPITSLNAEIATAFARHQGSLILDQLTELDRSTADALAGHTGSLSLNGLTHLTDETFAALAKYQGECLSLTGLNELSDAAATSLSEFSERLCLQKLTVDNEALRRKLEEQTLWENIQCDGNEFKPISS